MPATVRLALLLTALALALPSGASAKGAVSFTVCGADGCTKSGVRHGDAILMTAGEAGPPSRGAPFFRIRLTMGEPAVPGSGTAWTVYYVPSLGLARTTTPDGSGPVWTMLTDDARAVYDRTTRGLTPLPADQLPGVSRATRTVANPADDGNDALPWILGLGTAALVMTAIALAARRRGRGRLAATPPT